MNTVSSAPRGSTFVRCAIALAATRGIRAEAYDLACRAWGVGSRPAAVLKAAVAAGTVGGDSWSSPAFSELRAAAAEFFDLVNREAISGRMALRRVPLRVRTITTATGSVAYWAGEAKPKPLSAPQFDAETLAPLKIIAQAVVTDELIAAAADGDADAEAAVARDLRRAVADELDRSFVDPDNAGVAGEQPASITNGAPTISSTGNRGDDVAALVNGFGGDLMSAVFIMKPAIAMSLCSAEFPFAGVRGEVGTLPIIASRNAPAGAIVLADGDSIAFGAREALLDASNKTTLEFESSPSDPVDASTVMRSLWQENLTGLRVERAVNWRVARDGAVIVLTGVDYAGLGSPA